MPNKTNSAASGKGSPKLIILDARGIFGLLVNKEKLVNGKGQILFKLKGISTFITSKNAVGSILQDWLAELFQKRRIGFKTPPDTQTFPDFFLDPTSEITDLLELKTFDRDASANFDVANFEAYCSSLLKESYRLDADYLIFAYTLRGSILTITDIWLKKIWEICGPSGEFPIRVQSKRKVIYNIRPITWYSNGRGTYKAFPDKISFVKALYETLMKYNKTSTYSKNWLKEVDTNYFQHTRKHILPKSER